MQGEGKLFEAVARLCGNELVTVLIAPGATCGTVYPDVSATAFPSQRFRDICPTRFITWILCVRRCVLRTRSQRQRRTLEDLVLDASARNIQCDLDLTSPFASFQRCYGRFWWSTPRSEPRSTSSRATSGTPRPSPKPSVSCDTRGHLVCFHKLKIWVIVPRDRVDQGRI